MNWKNIASKALHALIPAGGATVGAVAVAIMAGTPIGLATLGPVAVGAFLAYMAKKARPDVPPAP